MLGWLERSPVRTRSPIELDSWSNELLSAEAAEICRSTVSLRAVLRSSLTANCAWVRFWTSAAISIPLPAPSDEMIEDVAEPVCITGRTAEVVLA